VGLRIRLSLISFGGDRSTDEEFSPEGRKSGAEGGEANPLLQPDSCFNIGTVFEGAQSKSITACERLNERRTKNIIYLSDNWTITVQMQSREVLKGMSTFVIKYEGRHTRDRPI